MLIQARLLLFALALVATVGCLGSQTASQEKEESNLKPLAVFFGRYLAQHRGQPPQDEAEFKQFLTEISPEELKTFNLTSTDQIFVSSRDKQPYVIIYGQPTGPSKGPGGAPIIAYEKVGVGGKRYVASSLAGVEEVDETRFRELVPNAAP